MSNMLQLSGKRRIFNALRSNNAISRAELAKICSLTRTAVSTIIDEMIANGLINEIGRGVSSGGKPPILLTLTPHSRCAVGIDLGDDYLIRGVLCDVAGNVLDEKVMEYENNFEKICDVIYLITSSLTKGISKDKFSGIGIAVSGIVNSSLDEVTGSSTLDIVSKGIVKALKNKIDTTILLEKRPNAAALAESLFGAGKIYNNMVYLTSGRGVGAGIVIDGSLYRGFSGGAGEIGRIYLQNGALLEEQSRPSTMTKEFSDVKNQKLPFASLVEAYHNKDNNATKIVFENAQNMAYAAISAANFFNPEAIILGGSLLEFGEEYFEHFKNSFKAVINNCECVPSFFGGSGVAVGGAHIVLDGLVR